jgi:hypothetical protein
MSEPSSRNPFAADPNLLTASIRATIDQLQQVAAQEMTIATIAEMVFQCDRLEILLRWKQKSLVQTSNEVPD